MSTPAHEPDGSPAGCRPTDVTAVELDAATLETIAPESLRKLKADLADEGYHPATLTAEADFGAGSMAAQAEVDRLRSLVRAAGFLGAGRLSLTVTEAADPDAVRPALRALTERARREGVALHVNAPFELD